VEIELRVTRLGNKSVTYGFELKREDELIAEGSITAACCEFEHGQPPRAFAIPDSFRDKLAPYVVEDSDT